MREIELSRARLRVREAGEGDRRVLFAVDPPNTLEMYGPLFARLKKHARAAAFEPPGFGHSKTKGGYGHSLEEQADVVIELLESLGARHVLAFPCVGAYVALRVAAKRPDLVAGLVLMQAPSWPQERAWVERVDKSGLLRTPGVGQTLMLLRGDSITRSWYAAALGDEQKARRFSKMAIECMDHGAKFPLATTFQALFRGDDPKFDAPACPMLAVWGPQDRSHRRSDPASIHEHAPEARLETFEACGHFPELEDPVRFVDLLVSWMDEHLR